MPTVLVGANVHGKPNYMAVAWVGILDFNYISIAIERRRHTYVGIKENHTFSINIPSFKMIQETDYCGIVSGRHADKGALFDNFYGKLGTAPMIRECPVNMECRVVQTVQSMPSHNVVIGEIVETVCDEEYLTDGKVDLARLEPILFVGIDGSYWKLGERFGKIATAGDELKVRAKERVHGVS